MLVVCPQPFTGMLPGVCRVVSCFLNVRLFAVTRFYIRYFVSLFVTMTGGICQLCLPLPYSCLLSIAK